jgi:hypothetical protein
MRRIVAYHGAPTLVRIDQETKGRISMTLNRRELLVRGGTAAA